MLEQGERDRRHFAIDPLPPEIRVITSSSQGPCSSLTSAQVQLLQHRRMRSGPQRVLLRARCFFHPPPPLCHSFHSPRHPVLIPAERVEEYVRKPRETGAHPTILASRSRADEGRQLAGKILKREREGVR
eukprot:758866-Hanusia_phi.AAC.2